MRIVNFGFHYPLSENSSGIRAEVGIAEALTKEDHAEDQALGGSVRLRRILMKVDKVRSYAPKTALLMVGNVRVPLITLLEVSQTQKRFYGSGLL